MVFFCSFFFKLLPKCSDFINSDDCIGKITSKSIRLKPSFILKNVEVIDRQIFSIEKMINLHDFGVP